MQPLSGLDATFLHLETPQMPMHVGALHVFELPAGQRGRFVTQLREHIASRLPAAPALRRKLWWMPLNLANPAWVEAQPDLRQHIVEVKLPPSARLGDGMAAMEAAVAELHPVLLDRERPLWKMHVLEGLAPSAMGLKRVGLYTQFHHAAVDGQAAVALAQVIMDLAPGGRPAGSLPAAPRGRGKAEPGWQEMLRGAIAHEATQVSQIVRQLPDTARALAGAAGQALLRSRLLAGESASASNLTLAPRTPLNASIGTGRAFAAISLPLDVLKASARLHEATLNDIVLLLVAGALRRWLAAHGGVPRKSLVAAVPISLRSKGDARSDNQASMSLVSLGTHIADLGKRLAHIREASQAMKATVGGLKQVLPTDFPSIGVPWLVEAVTRLYGKAKLADRLPLVANLVVSNVQGPPVPLYMAGARMTANYPTSIVVHGMALNVTVQSYDRQLDFGLMADADAMPDVARLADALRVAFDDLCALDAELQAPPTLADTGAKLANEAGRQMQKRVTEGLGAVGGAVGGATGRLVSGMVATVVGGAVRRAVQQTLGGGAKPKAAASGKAAPPAAKPAPAAAPAADVPARRTPRRRASAPR